MTKIPFRKLVFLIAVFFTHGQNFAQRWVPEDDFNHIKTFDNVLNQTISSLSLIKPSEENGEVSENRDLSPKALGINALALSQPIFRPKPAW